MHPFIHPLSEAVTPLWESKTDWEIYKLISKRFSEIGGPYLGTRKDIVLVPLLHDTPGELGQPFAPKDWKQGECDLIPGKTAPSMVVVERNYNDIHRKYTSIGPLLDKLGNGGKGINWNTEHEIHELTSFNHPVHDEGVSKGRPRLDTAIDAAEMILQLAPETNGHVSVKAWEALSKITGRDHTHLAVGREHDKIHFRDIIAQPRKIISAPTWSGLESEEVSYNAGYTNVHELIPWRTINRPPAVLSGSPLDAGFRRRLLCLPSGHRHQVHGQHVWCQTEWQSGDHAELPHAAPEVGHPQHVFGQPADAVAEPGRSARVDLGR